MPSTPKPGPSTGPTHRADAQDAGQQPGGSAASQRRRRGSGQPSLHDVAVVAGVSHQTVSRVVNGATNVAPTTRTTVQAAIDALGYRRNSLGHSLASLRSGRLGFITSHLHEYGPNTFNLALHDAAAAAGFEVILISLSRADPPTIAEAFDRLHDQAVEAIVVATNNRGVVTTVRHRPHRVPVVVVSGARERHPLSIGIDNAPGAQLATDHLLRQGHRSVAIVTGPPEWIEGHQRIAGWRRAHHERGRVPGPVWTGDWTPASGYRAGLVIADRRDITAVFAGNDQMALGVLLALAEKGRRVPEDVSVMGFDDIPEAAFFHPPLTTVHQDFGEVARGALDLAVQAIAGDADLATLRIDARLVERSTTAAPPHPRGVNR